MTSKSSRVRVSTCAQPSPPLNPHYNQPLGHWHCVKSSLVGGRDKYQIRPTFWLCPFALWLFSWTVWHSYQTVFLIINSRLKAKRPPASAWPPPSGWATLRTLYSKHWTPWSSVSYNQVSVPGLMLIESTFSLAHQAHIALSEPKTSIVQQCLNLSL